VSGTVFRGTSASGNRIPGATVQLCQGLGFVGSCSVAQANSSGQYTFSGQAPGWYSVSVFPPANVNVLPRSVGPINVVAQTTTTRDIELNGPVLPPVGTAITPVRIDPTISSGVPIIFWNSPHTLTTRGCVGGSATYRLSLLRDGITYQSGAMSETTAGNYSATLPALVALGTPIYGNAHIVMVIDCPSARITTEFDLYIDPSGTVVTTTGIPISGATVTLLQSEGAGGPFVAVADGSAAMSIVNRRNPDSSDASGHFGWDVVPGFYKVRVTKSGCGSDSTPSQAFVESEILSIPPAVTDLTLTMRCAPVISAHSLFLNGQSDFGESVVTADLNITGDWTVEAWFKDESAFGFNHDYQTLLNKGDRDANAEAPYFLSIGYKTLVAGLRSAWTDYTVRYDLRSGAIDPKKWHHAAATFRASTRSLTIYLDGGQVAQGVLPTNSRGNDLPVQLGRNGQKSGKYFQGKLDDVRIWSVVRTPAEIGAKFREELPGTVNGLVANWRFNEITAEVTPDLIGIHPATISPGATLSDDIHQ
jgi:hypothetical protein